MTYADEIKERKEIAAHTSALHTVELSGVFECFELRIMEQDALILEQSDSLIALRASLDGGMVELVGELVKPIHIHCNKCSPGETNCQSKEC